MSSSDRIAAVCIVASSDSGTSLSDNGWCSLWRKVRVYLNVILFVCTLCARSRKFQDLLFKGNNHFFFQTEVSKTITSDSVKYSGLFKSQHYYYVALPFGRELNRVCEYICIPVLWYIILGGNLTILLWYIIHWILVYFVIYHSRVIFKNSSIYLSVFCHLFWNSQTKDPRC